MMHNVFKSFEPFEKWEWKVPTLFNIGVACADSQISTPLADSLAMIVEDDALGTDTITFTELSHKTNQFAQLLRNLKLNKGDRVLVRLPNSLAYPIAFLGTMKMGAIAVPTSTLLTAEEVAYLAKDSGASVLVTDAKAWQAMSAQIKQNLQETPHLKHIVVTEAEQVETDEALNVLSLKAALMAIKEIQPAEKTLADDPAYLVYTSGTTGYPKGVLHAHRAMLGRQPAAKYWFNYADDSARQNYAFW
jgi:acetyl-CoA synthetase